MFEVPFLELDGVEVANGARTLTYLQKLGSPFWNIGTTGCLVQNREAAAPAGGIFVSPTADVAPWYDATVAESAEFMGVLATTMDWANEDWTRSVSQRGGSLGGANIGPPMQAGRMVKVSGLLTAISAAGLEYGRAWLQEKLLGSGCTNMTVRLRDACPPDDGSNDTRGEWILYDAACIGGLQSPGDLAYKCTDYEEIAFTLVASLPGRYKRRQTTTAKTAITQSKVMGPPPPGTVTDSFTRANTGPPPSASWTSKINASDPTTNLVVVSNQLKANSISFSPAYWNAGTMGRDHMVSVLIGTADTAGGVVALFARLQSPGTALVSGFEAYVYTISGNTQCRMLSCQDGSGTFKAIAQTHQTTGLVLTSGDRLSIVCRGPAVECWHVRPSTGVATRLGVCYDDVTGSTQLSLAFYGGIGIGSTTLTLDDFTETLIASQAGIELPTLDPIVVDLGAPKIGANALVLTLDNSLETYQPIKGLRVIRKAATAAQVIASDDFTTNKLATKWIKRLGPATPWNVTGGQLKPLAAAVASETQEIWSQDGTLNGIRPASRMVARVDIHTGSTLVGGQWGVLIGVGEDGYLLGNLLGSGTFRISTIFPGGSEVIAFSKGVTLATATTYTIVVESEYQGRRSAWLMGPGGDCLANLFIGTPNGYFGLTPVPYFGAGLRMVAADTVEFYDNFFAADVGPETNTMNVAQVPPYDSAVLDSARHALTWTDYNPTTGVTTVRDGAGVLQLDTWTSQLTGPQFGWQETNGEQESSLIIPHQGGLSIDSPPKYQVDQQAHRA